jgi:hypothetical protein
MLALLAIVTQTLCHSHTYLQRMKRRALQDFTPLAGRIGDPSNCNTLSADRTVTNLQESEPAGWKSELLLVCPAVRRGRIALRQKLA